MVTLAKTIRHYQFDYRMQYFPALSVIKGEGVNDD